MFFNFNEGKEVNPLEGITRFFVNPLNPKLFLKLDIQRLAEGVKPKYGYENGLPVFIYPIHVLNLGVCIVSWSSKTTGVVQGDKYAFLFHLTENALVIDRVFSLI